MEVMTAAGIVYGLHNGDHIYRYIGHTKRSAQQRMYSHRSKARAGSKYPVYEWMREEGIENIQIEVIEGVIKENLGSLCERERFHIAQAFENEDYRGQILNFDEREFNARKEAALAEYRKQIETEIAQRELTEKEGK